MAKSAEELKQLSIKEFTEAASASPVLRAELVKA